MKRPAKPKPFSLDTIKCRAIRGPHKEHAERWYWQALRYEGGKQLAVWSGWATIAEVKAALAPILMGQEPAPTRAEDRVETVRDLMETWLAWQEARADLADASKVASGKAARWVCEIMGDVLISRLDTLTLEEHQRTRLRMKAASGTVRNEINAIVHAWNWGQDRGLTPERRLRRPKLVVKPVLSRYVPDAVEFWKALDAVAAGPHPWARTMLLIMGATGARSGEVATLTWDDVFFDRRKIRFDGKTGERYASVAQPIMDELARLKPEGATGRVLPVAVKTAKTEIRVALKLACEAAKIPRILPKQIRTMVENMMFDAGADPGVVSAQLGHTPEVSLRHYRQAKASRIEEVLDAAGIGIRPEDNVVSLAERKRARGGET